MKRTLIPDVGFLVRNPRWIREPREDRVGIAFAVIEELERIQSDKSPKGLRALEAYLQVRLALSESGDRVEVLTDGQVGGSTPRGSIEDRILGTALALASKGSSGSTLVITDLLSLELRAQQHKLEILNSSDLAVPLYSGIIELMVSGALFHRFSSGESIEVAGRELFPNQAVVLVSTEYPDQKVCGLVSSDLTIKPFKDDEFRSAYKLSPRSLEQRFALALLMSPAIPLVTIAGKAGTGKTLLAIAAGMQQVQTQDYSRLLVSRPVQPMGQDIGYLPGEVGEKLDPWMQPIYDNFDVLSTVSGSSKRGNPRAPKRRAYEDYVEQGLLQVEPLTYIRGRSLPMQFFLIDEAQNLSRHELKTILTRAGEGSKIVLTGDLDQIDNPKVDEISSGLAQIVERFKGSSRAGHITLTKSERSPLAEEASNLL
jgi:PhoH-like ATPase